MKRLFILTLLTCMFVANAAAQSGTLKENTNISWSFDLNTNTLSISGSGKMDDFHDTNTAPWVTEYVTFHGLNLPMSVLIYKVVITGNITRIGNSAFDGCTEISSVSLPNSIEEIGEYAFKSCRNLELEQVPSNLNKIETGAFSGCTKMMTDGAIYVSDVLVQGSIDATTITVKEGITEILANAFKGNTNIKTVTFADNSLKKIGNDAFNGCTNLSTLNIPSTVTSWGTNIFAGCDSLPVDGDYHMAGDHVIVKVSKTGEKQYRIPSNIIYIAENAFSACDKVTKIVSEHTTIPQVATSAFTFTKIETPNIYVADGKETECSNKWGIAATKINYTTIAVGSTGYATVSLEHSAEVPSGVKAYTVYVEDGQIKLKEVSKLAKHAGYMLYGDVNNHIFKPLGNSYSETEKNDLVGLQEDEELSGSDKYLLTSRNGDVKFRCLDKTSKVLTAGKAYLSVPNATASEYFVRIISNDDTETDIDETLENNAHANNRTIYNIAGQRVNQPRQGLNIIDGKLVIM